MNSRPPILTALLNPLNLSMLAVTVAAGLCSAWWLAPVGLVLWLVMVIVIARDPGVKITFTRQSREPLAQRYQVRFDRLDRARITIFNTMQRVGNASFRKSIEPVQSSLDDLTENAYQLSLQMSALDNNFAIQRISNNFEDEIEKMQNNIRGAANASDRREFEQTLASLNTRQTQLNQIANLLSRFEAQLAGTNNAIDGLVTGLVGLQGRGSTQIEAKVAQFLKIIQTEKDELNQFDAELEKISLI